MKRTAIVTMVALGFHLTLLTAPAAAAAGDLDPTFGNGGIVVGPFGYEANDVAIQSDGRIVAGGYDRDAERTAFAVGRYLANGQPDSTFGGDGTVLTDLGCNEDGVSYDGGVINAVVIQRVQGPAGAVEKILVAGSRWCTYVDDPRSWILARYEPDGSLDPTFGANGIAQLPFGGTYPEGITDIVLDSLGRIVAVGPGFSSRSVGGTDPNFAVARLLPNGAPDPSFGEGGVTVTVFPGDTSSTLWSIPYAVALTTVRRGGADVEMIVAAGSAVSLYGYVALARYLPNGALDVSFGTNGTTKFRGGRATAAQDLAVQADGKLVVATGRYSLLVRFHPDGALDDSFGVGGQVSNPDSCYSNCYVAENVTVQNDGSIVAAGLTGHPTYSFAVARYLPNGELDPSFAGGTVVQTAIGSSSEARAIALQPDGRILLAGYGVSASGSGFALTRYRAAEPPEAPVLTAAAGNATVHLEWTSPADGGSPITGYRIYRGTASGQETLLTTVGKVNSFDDSGLVNGTRYFYRVSAVNALGEGSSSNEVSATPATVPGAPNLTAQPGKPKGVTLTWTIPPNGGSPITGYRIYRGTSAGGETLFKTVGTGTSYKDTSTTKGTTYFYIVRAVNAVGEGPASNGASAMAS
jgi:uncharacterized delta-60 repeat protein